MSILVFAEHENNQYKKSSLEAVSYGKQLAGSLNTQCVAVSLGNGNSEALNSLKNYGADIIAHYPAESGYAPGMIAEAMIHAGQHYQADVVIISGTYNGKSAAPRISVSLEAGIVSGVVGLPETSSFSVKKSCFSNKAFTYVGIKSSKKLLVLVPNSIDIVTFNSEGKVENHDLSVQSQISVLQVSKEQGKIPLTEAEIVVSGGRGLKGPENWGMVEELAGLLNAATACSKPVSDMDWRPHSEHVGQTGITIKPNLYIAIGISGAIQHLAGVGSSKVICVINKDPEAPFFKAADYGIVGDAFEIVPKIIQRAKELLHS